ncbi:uncharacterized protein LOC143563132 [Bidens hawaiensis]|uniref:uncharacterized protein LOC143563132 n=1 Tax=Bidens hawaiensis TaxID=980011 RepID=UPI004048F596
MTSAIQFCCRFLYTVFDKPSSWERFLFLAEFSYNTSHHTAINMSPFKALYGRDVNTIHDYTPGSNTNASIDLSLTTHQTILATLKSSLEQARTRMTTQANKKRLEKEFNIGNFVYLKLRQHSVQHRKNQKLSKCFFGPYKILERIGKVAYRLELPPTSKIHPIFHVSLLKECHGTCHPPADSLDKFEATEVSILPEVVLNSRTDEDNKKQLLIKWEKMPLEDATWEDEAKMKQLYPFFTDIEDNANSSGGGDVTNLSGPTAAAQAQDKPNGYNRPKRHTRKPNRFVD